MPATATAQPSATCCAPCLRPTSGPVPSARHNSGPPQPCPRLPPRHLSVPGRPGPADRESPRLSHLTSTEIAGRIEDLYGAPLADLEAHAQDQPPGMLSALLGMHDDLALAERGIDFHRDHLARLIQPERQIGRDEVSHLLDGSRRLAEAVAVRDVQAKSVLAVLQSLARVPAPAPSPPTPSPPVPAPPLPAPSTAHSR